MIRIVFILIVLSLSASAGAQQILRWQQAGVWHYGSTAPPGVQAEYYQPGGGVPLAAPAPDPDEVARRAELDRSAEDWMRERERLAAERRRADLRARIADNEAERVRNEKCLGLARAQASARDSGTATDYGRLYRQQCQP